MRIAMRLSTSDIYPLTAGLLGNARSMIERTECDFRELRLCDRAFVIMKEWKRRLEDRQESPTAEKMVQVFEEMESTMETTKHVVCMV